MPWNVTNVQMHGSETYDGASFMSFELKGVQAKIKEIRWPELGFREVVLQT